MLRAFILADDLSGAADAGVAFTGAGLSTIVSLQDAMGATDAEVLSVDADTRHRSSGAAAQIIRRLVLQFGAQQDLLFFKKIDSTLRGHVGVELAAALEAYRSLHPDLERPVAVCAPAFPSSGRTTRQGMQWMHGDPLHRTEFWRVHGMTHAGYLPDMFGTAGLDAALISLSSVRSVASELTQAMRAIAGRADVLVCDAETDNDLQAIAGASMKLGRKVLLVGSAGLANHLPLAAGLCRDAARAKERLAPIPGPLLFVIGSLSRRSMEQVELLTSCSLVLRVSVPPDILLLGEGSMAWREYQRRLEQAIERQADVVLCPGPERQVDIEDRPQLTASLARMTAPVWDKVGALIGAGGETARSVLQCWGVTGLRLLQEMETGVPVSVTEGWKRQLPVITKAGDFGRPETLLCCSTFLRDGEV